MAENMINQKEVRYSEKYLYEFFKSLKPKEKRNIGLMGGWAVYFLLKKMDIDHIGSRDIDIFFNPEEISFQDLVKKVESQGFQPHSTFRWARYVQYSTQKELTETKSKKVPIYDLITVYLDISCPKKINKRIMYIPIIDKIFNGENILVKFRGLEILIPSSKIMMEMKLNSVTTRTDTFKREKDLTDIFSLVYYDDSNWYIKNGNRIRTEGINRKLIKNFQSKITNFTRDGTIINASKMIKVSPESIINLLKKM